MSSPFADTVGESDWEKETPTHPIGGASRFRTIRNMGAGTLNWSATENAGWLTLSVGTGTANGTVTLPVPPAIGKTPPRKPSVSATPAAAPIYG